MDLIVPLGFTTVNFGQICAVLSQTGDVVSAREEDFSARDNVVVSRGERRSMEIRQSSTGPSPTSRQNGVAGVSFDDSKAVCEVNRFLALID